MSKRPEPGVLMIATVLGVGLLRGAPGTYGTLAAVPLAYALGRLGPLWVLGGAVAVTVLGAWAAGRYCAATDCHDNQQIVIDEVAGFLITMVLVAPTPVGLLLGFGLFRLFDILKPWPVSVIDRRVKGGFGVLADDLAAGTLAALVLRGLVAWLPPSLVAWGVR